MFMTQEDDQDWPKVVQQLVDNYNETPQTTTQVPPQELAAETNEDLLKDVKEKIKKKTTDMNEKNDKEFQVGDRVRLKLVVKKNYKQHEFWTKKVFTIHKVFHPKTDYSRPYYYVKDDKGTVFKEKLYNNDLQVVNEIKNKVKQPELHQVSKLLNRFKRDNRVYFTVLWNVGEITEEPRTSLIKDIPKMVKQFESKKKR